MNEAITPAANDIWQHYCVTPVVRSDDVLLCAAQVFNELIQVNGEYVCQYEQAIKAGLISWQSICFDACRLAAQVDSKWIALHLTVSELEFDFIAHAARFFKVYSLYDNETLLMWCRNHYPKCVADYAPNERETWSEYCKQWIFYQ